MARINAPLLREVSPVDDAAAIGKRGGEKKPATRAGSGDCYGQPEILANFEMAESGATVQSR